MLLEFKNVSIDLAPPFDAGIADVSFALEPGELALVRLEEHVPHLPIGDAAQGLVELKQGEVLFDGKNWSRTKAAEVSHLRSQMGRVFEWYGWISNLDVDENILLAQRTHTTRSDQELIEEAARLAADFKLEAIPHSRPVMIPRGVLRRCQWIRAFMGQPKLIILERPTRELPDLWSDVLVAKVNEFRRRGTAFLWLTEEPHEWNLPAVNASLKFEMHGTKMQRVE